jgi:uncharacterized membrane protein
MPAEPPTDPARETPTGGVRPGRLTPPGRTGRAATPFRVRPDRRPVEAPVRGPATAPDAGRPGRPGRPARAAQARARRAVGLDVPRTSHGLQAPKLDPELFGRMSERFARFMGTARFLFYMTVFVAVWLAWNTFTPPALQFDPRALNYTLLTLILSLQASYAAPLILLAQNRQDDRDRVALEQDRQRTERSLSDTEYLARELVSLRIALSDVATRDFVRSELRDLLAELDRSDRSDRSERAATRAPDQDG